MPRSRLTLDLPRSAQAQELAPGPASLNLASIGRRSTEATRPADAEHVVALAESIAVLGLLEPILVDTKGNLLAGLHRLYACELLAKEPAERQAAFLAGAQYASQPVDGDDLQATVAQVFERAQALPRKDLSPLPVLVVSVPAKGREAQTLAIEAAENTVRRSYTAAEVTALAERFRTAGYVASTGGRPAEGQTTVMTALEAALGRSKRHIQRILSDEKPVRRRGAVWERAKRRTRNAVKGLLATAARRKDADAVVELANKLIEALGPEESK